MNSVTSSQPIFQRYLLACNVPETEAILIPEGELVSFLIFIIFSKSSPEDKLLKFMWERKEGEEERERYKHIDVE